jgi:hypothetical protein
MGTLYLLAKINVIIQVAEKVAYGAIGLFSIFVAKKYVEDYRESVAEEKIKGGVEK